ncbi:tRNA lysidine(34) synthetase TilS [Methylomarinum sp. Ch1-1]|uniref:tRNA(Ile)-lysidine synthase n=1 Tax=Methylomarinum roseum TaxID=3067653 RepID=A0AAU7NZM7_9GAMM|nr:tRNA lysidine(34) synthetase TilS [Methylomarinum sp. Ch1-1]MDP4521404.1 tRNA lysidine(34) synthetase TilS [Methylomarinum sp. Ch1-1]
MTKLTAALIDTILPANTARIFVAYSGGVDSQVLLHLCANEPDYRQRLTAVYVHHGLQREADVWAEHCRVSAERLGVEFKELRVDASAKKRQSPEDAARTARYEALRALLARDDVLLVAQHREDQLETVLLQLFRGAGVSGLAAMPERTEFGKGWLLRPLLTVGKRSILDYADSHRLHWVEDPSNQADDFDRNYLRNNIVPLLKQRWPSLDKTVARSARHCAAAAELLAGLADDLLEDCYDRRDRSLAVQDLLALDLSKRNLVLRRWLEMQGLKPPGEALLQTLIAEVACAGPEADPELRTQGREIKRYRGRLYCLPASAPVKEKTREWPQGVSEIACANGYRLRIAPSSSGIPVGLWRQAKVTIKPREGGEMLKLIGRKGRHALKKLYQEAAVPPWQREQRPLIYLDGQLAAVAGLWVAEAFFSAGEESCYQVLWESIE